jgi:hypothetical protein
MCRGGRQGLRALEICHDAGAKAKNVTSLLPQPSELAASFISE